MFLEVAIDNQSKITTVYYFQSNIGEKGRESSHRVDQLKVLSSVACTINIL